MSSTTSWICDACGEIIEREQLGQLAFLGRRDGTAYGLRLVLSASSSPRTAGCHYETEELPKGVVARTLEAAAPLGPSALMELLEFVATERLPKDEVVEMIKRLHVPGYEHARFHLDDAYSKGLIERRNAAGFPNEQQIRIVLQEYCGGAKR